MEALARAGGLSGLFDGGDGPAGLSPPEQASVDGGLGGVDQLFGRQDRAAVEQGSGHGGGRNPFVDRQIDGLEMVLDHLDVPGEATPHPVGCADPYPLLGGEPQVMEGEDGVVAEVRVPADAQHSLHEFVPPGRTDVLEPVEPIGDVFETASRRQLPQFDGRHAEVRRVLGGDVAVLVQGPLPHPATIGIGQAHRLTPTFHTVPKTVRFSHRQSVHQAVDADGVRAEWVEAVAATPDQPTIILFYDPSARNTERVRLVAGKLAISTGARVLTVECTTAEEGVRAYAWVLGEGLDPDTTSFIGESVDSPVPAAVRRGVEALGLPQPGPGLRT